jgi:4-amino-4-deoxy-L-arabinose transferase-like glycosyltransferase
MYKKLLVVSVLILAFGLRFWNVSLVPAGLYYDEIDAGYQARSIMETGKDYRDNWSPFFINSFVDPRPPLPIYLTVLSTVIFSSPELQVRMGSVIVGTLNILLVFMLLWRWSKNFYLSLTGMIITSINPWWLQFARFNHESNIMTLTILISLISLTFALEQRKIFYWIISILSFGLGMYTYRTMSMFSIILVCLTGIQRLSYRLRSWC